jgi:hypothetical protein
MAEEQIHNAESSAPEGDPQKRRRRRGNRGGRGRGRSRPAVETAANAQTSDSVGDNPAHEKPSLEERPRAQRETKAESSIDTEGSESSLDQDVERERAEPPTKPPLSQHQRSAPRPQHPRPPTKPATSEQISSAVGEAIEEVYRITEVLKRVLEDLDELLETLELAERQKLEDDRELDSLRRALRLLTPRPQQQQSPRHEQPAPRGPQRHPERPQERHRGAPASPPPSSRAATEQSPEDDVAPPQS